MVAIVLAQTNGLVASYNAGSSGATDGDVTVGADMTDGGSLGSTEFQPDTVNGTDADRGCIRWLSTAVIGETTWDGGAGAAGDYVVSINITMALASNFIEEVHIDELQDDGTTYVNVANSTGLQVSIASTGVQTITVNRGSDFTPKNVDSKLSITVVFQSDRSHGGVSFGVTPDQNITTPIQVSAVPKTATGAWSLPVPTVAGIGEVGEKSGAGAWTLPIPTVAGAGEVGEKAGVGAWTLPVPTVAGLGEVGEKSGVGAWTLPVPTIAGVGVLTGLRVATGAWTLPVPTVAGLGEVGEKAGAGAWTLPVPTIAGAGTVTTGGAPKTGAGGWTLPIPTVAGVGEVGRKSGAGAWTLPVPTVAGVGEVGEKAGVGAWTLPVPTVAGIGQVGAKAGVGAWTLPVPTVAGVGVHGPTGAGAWTLPVPTVAGVGEVGEKAGVGAWTLPVPTIAGIGQVGTKEGAGAWTLPIPTVAGVGVLTGLRTGAGGWTLPVPTVAGVGEVLPPAKTAAGAWTLPLPTIAGFGALSLTCPRQYVIGIDMDGNDIFDVGAITVVNASSYQSKTFAGVVRPLLGIDASDNVLMHQAVAGGQMYWRNSTDTATLMTLEDDGELTINGVNAEARLHVFDLDGTTPHLKLESTAVGPAGDVVQQWINTDQVWQLSLSASSGSLILRDVTAGQNLFFFETGSAFEVVSPGDAILAINADTGAAGTADCFIRYKIASSAIWAVGIDNNNTDQYVIRAGTTPSSGTLALAATTGGDILIGTQTVGAGKLQVAGDVNLLTNTLLQARYPVEAVSSGGTQDDTHEYVEVDTASGALTRTLPPKATSVGKRYTIKNLGPNTLTVDGDGTETIDTFQSVDYSSGSSFTFMCFASGWRLV